MAGTSGVKNFSIGQKNCHREWLNLQEQDLSELLQALNLKENGHFVDDHEVIFKNLIEKTMDQYQEYADQRAQLASEHASPYFASTWCPHLESSLLWLGGCRPTCFFQLVYARMGLQTEAFWKELLDRANETIDEPFVSCDQLLSIGRLRRNTVAEENKLSKAMTSMQEGMEDYPFAAIVRNMKLHHVKENEEEAVVLMETEATAAAEEALKKHYNFIALMLQEADKLRVKTLKELIKIFKPHQAMEFLISSKKLHLFIHQWGKNSDNMHG